MAFGSDGDTLTNLVQVESQGAVVETALTNNDDSALLVLGVLPATGQNLATFAWTGFTLLVLGGALLFWLEQRRADRLWIDHGIRF